MSKKKSKAMTIDEYLNSLSEEERFKMKTLGIHGSYNAQLGVEEHLRKQAFKEIEKLSPLAAKGEKFNRTSEEQKEIAKKGGEGKFIRGYDQFKQWVIETKFDVKSYQETSNENFRIVLSREKKPFILSAKTADKYKKIYLLELSR